MSWLFYALLSPALFTVVNFGDKYIVEREVRDAQAMPVYAALTALLSGVVLWVLVGFPVLPARDALLVLLTGLISGWAAALYFRAMAYEEASKVIVLIQMRPVLVLVLSVVFLNEIITLEQLMGFVLILLAAVGISISRGSVGRFQLSPAFVLILIVDLMWAASIVLFKFVVSEARFADVLPYESWGLALGGLSLYVFIPAIRQAFNHSVRAVRRRAVAMIFLNESLFVVAKLMTFIAVALGPVALVSVLGSTQAFMGILVGWLLTSVAPAVFRETTSRGSLAKKALLAVFLFGGIWLVH